MLKFHRWPVRRAPTVAPIRKSYDDRFEAHAHFRWSVVVLRLRIAALAAHKQTPDHESIQPFRQDVGGDREAPLEVGKAGEPAEQRITQNEKAPSLADDFQSARG